MTSQFNDIIVQKIYAHVEYTVSYKTYISDFLYLKN